MAEWCAQNLRNCAAWRDAGLSMSTTSDECAKMFDATVRQLVSWMDCDAVGGLEATMKLMRECDERAVLPRSFELGLHALGGSKSVLSDQQFAQDIDALVSDSFAHGNPREQRHAKAVKQFAYGDLDAAAQTWEEILRDHPNDLFAVKFSHESYFLMGENDEKKASIERIIGGWDKTDPMYSYLHGMLAFGLEECGQYDKAEKEADIAISLRPQDCWAVHAKAHCLEMTSRVEEGVAFMQGCVEQWRPCYILACHNYWHMCLFYIEQQRYEEALELFDSEVLRRTVSSGAMLDLVDAASLLWRLEMEGVDVGDRWHDFPPLTKHIHDHCTSFNDTHMAAVLQRTRADSAISAMRGSMEEFASPASQQSRIMKDVGLPLFDAMLAFGEQEWTNAAEKMLPVRDEIIRIGGSHAQRDVYSQTLFYSCLRSSHKEHFDMVPTILAERDALRIGSGPLTGRLREKYQKALDERK